MFRIVPDHVHEEGQGHENGDLQSHLNKELAVEQKGKNTFSPESGGKLKPRTAILKLDEFKFEPEEYQQKCFWTPGNEDTWTYQVGEVVKRSPPDKKDQKRHGMI